jgi:2-polyprenyl-6-methoxyphenol hydroxylase-like FAD-dependent oxidoreductase
MLDVHLSGPAVGVALRERGHDVLVVDQSPELQEAEDIELLRLARDEGRILITSNVGDFMEHTTEWAYAGESHAGVIMVVYQATRARFGLLIRGIEELLEGTSQEQWTDRIRWLGRR